MSPRPLGKRLFYVVSRHVTRVMFSALFRIRCFGRSNYPPSGGLLVCANHQSMYDPMLIGLTCDRRMNYLARKSLFKYAPFRFLIELLDAIPIERDGMGIGGLKETMRRLKRGEIVVIFPEGTRTPDGRLSPIKPGFAALVRRTNVPIITLGMDGSYQSWPKGQTLPGRATIHIHIGPEIGRSQIAEWSDEQLVQAVANGMKMCLERSQATRAAAKR